MESDDVDEYAECYPRLEPGSVDFVVQHTVMADAGRCLSWLLSHGLDVSRDFEGATLLDYAAGLGLVDMVEKLLAAGTPLRGVLLMSAAYANSIEVVRQLLEAGADPDQGLADAPTALGTAQAMGHAEMERLLVSFGAKRLVGRTP